MFDIKTGAIALTIIAFLVIDRSYQNASIGELKGEMKQMKTKIELLKDFHYNAQETIELESDNRKSENKIHFDMIT